MTKSDTHVTRRKLEGTPFDKAKDLQAAKDDIFAEMWRHVERARALRSIISSPENEFFVEFFKEPWRCSISNEHNEILSINLSPENTPSIKLNKQYCEDEHKTELVEGVIRSMLGVFSSEYLDTVRIKASVASPISQKNKG